VVVSSNPIADHTLALKVDGTLWSWGGNTAGQLGNGTTAGNPNIAQVLLENDNNYVYDENVRNDDWVAVSAGGSYSLALKADGTLWSWGSNNYGRLGLGNNNDAGNGMKNESRPVRVGTDNDWVTISAGLYHAMAIKFDGSLYAWGRNNDGQLGIGTGGPGTERNVPTRVGDDSNWKAVACNSDFTVALKTDGSLWTWGSNNEGQLGLGYESPVESYFITVPNQVGEETDWEIISAGGSVIAEGTTVNTYTFALAIKTNGQLWGWGYNGWCQLNDGTQERRNVPSTRAVDSEDDIRVWAGIEASSTHVIFINPSGALFGIGNNQYGKLGDGTTEFSGTNPVSISLRE
jgi:alpha-tubulin suppressor-like RCC1 family protein